MKISLNAAESAIAKISLLLTVPQKACSGSKLKRRRYDFHATSCWTISFFKRAHTTRSISKQ